MSVQRYQRAGQPVRWRARVKSHGHEVATRVFDRKTDAVAWEQDQVRRLRVGEWTDPRRGLVPLQTIADAWLETRGGVKRRTRETDELMWRRYVAPRFGTRPASSVTTAEITEWAAQMVANGKSVATAKRAMSTLRSILDHGIADERLTRNAAATAKAPRGAATREGQALTEDEVSALAQACRGTYSEVVVVLAYTGMRWGELAGLQVGDRIQVPGPGLRLQRAVLAGGGSGELFVDSLKTHQARTIPMTTNVVEIVDRWSANKATHEWLFATTTGTAMREGNWQRQVAWREAKATIGRPTLRVHDLRHTAASIWLGRGADPKVVQRILGHASATMTMDLYGHLIDSNLWNAADRVSTRGHHGGTDPTQLIGRNGV